MALPLVLTAASSLAGGLGTGLGSSLGGGGGSSGPVYVTPSITAPWNSPFAVGSGANATASQNDPNTAAALGPGGGNQTILYLGLGVAAIIGLALVSRQK